MTFSSISCYLVVVFCVFMMSCESANTISKPMQNSTIDEPGIWAGSKYEPTSVDMRLTKISEHVYYVNGPAGAATDNEGFMSNAAVIIGNNGVVVFDSLGTPSLAYLLRKKIKAITDKPVIMVIVSHYHADHIYGLQVFKEEGAKIFAPLGAKTYIESEVAQDRLEERRESLRPWVNKNTYIVRPDEYVTRMRKIDIGGVSLRLDTLGKTHSHGDLIARVKPDNVLLAGDIVFEGRIPFLPGSKHKKWLQYLSALDVTKLSVIVPGHGPASYQPKRALVNTTQYLTYVDTAMKNAVDELIPFSDVYEQTDWSKYKNDPAFQAANRLNAYSVYLELERESVAE